MSGKIAARTKQLYFLFYKWSRKHAELKSFESTLGGWAGGESDLKADLQAARSPK